MNERNRTKKRRLRTKSAKISVTVMKQNQWHKHISMVTKLTEEQWKWDTNWTENKTRNVQLRLDIDEQNVHLNKYIDTMFQT